MKLTALLCLLSLPALAQDLVDGTGGASGCLGNPHIRCGLSASLFEVRPGLSGQGGAVFAPGAGPMLEYLWRAWSLAVALLGNGLFRAGAQPQGEATFALYACAGEPLGFLSGSCAGPGVVLAGPNGGLFGGFTWRGSTGLLFTLSPRMLGWLQVGP